MILPVPLRTRTRATASFRRPVVWIRGLGKCRPLAWWSGARTCTGTCRQRMVDRLLRVVRVRGTAVDLQLLQHAGDRAGPSAACAAPRGARPSPGRGPSGARGSRCGYHPGNRCGGGTACRSPSWGRSSSFDALITITWSPVSTCGAQIGLCLPRNRVAISVDMRPRMAPSASITSQRRVMSAGRGVNVRNRNNFLREFRRRVQRELRLGAEMAASRPSGEQVQDSGPPEKIDNRRTRASGASRIRANLAP